MVNIASIILAVIKLVQGFISWASERNLLNAGAKAQLADSLFQTTKMVADAKKIEELFHDLPDDVVGDILLNYYSRDKR